MKIVAKMVECLFVKIAMRSVRPHGCYWVVWAVPANALTMSVAYLSLTTSEQALVP